MKLETSQEQIAPDAPLSRKPYTYTCRNIPWTDERIARLKELWNGEELSVNQIARQLGVTRGSVIGKAHRLGLPSHEHMNGNLRKKAPPLKPKLLRIKPSLPPVIEP